MESQSLTIGDQQQVDLFRTFYGNDEHKYSNVVEIWDIAPKYSPFPTKFGGKTVTENQVMEREFMFKDVNYRVRVSAGAFINNKGETIIRFPSRREELIEDALRRLALNQSLASLNREIKNGEQVKVYGVRFSVNMLKKEMALYGHNLNHLQLVEGLMVMSRSVVEIAISSGRRRALYTSAILHNIAVVGRDDFLADPESLWRASFHPMVVQCLSTVDYRQYDYITGMGYKIALSRFLHKLLSLEYVNAGLATPFRILMSVIKKKSGLLNFSRTRDQLTAATEALEALKSGLHPILSVFEHTSIFDGRRLVDVEFCLYPTPEFIKEVKWANARQRDGRDQLSDDNVL